MKARDTYVQLSRHRITMCITNVFSRVGGYREFHQRTKIFHHTEVTKSESGARLDLLALARRLRFLRRDVPISNNRDSFFFAHTLSSVTEAHTFCSGSSQHGLIKRHIELMQVLAFRHLRTSLNRSQNAPARNPTLSSARVHLTQRRESSK